MPSSPTPHGHPLPCPHATAYLYSLFQSCFCLVYLGLILPFLWQFAKREARVGDLMESEGKGGVEGGEGYQSLGPVSLAHRD